MSAAVEASRFPVLDPVGKGDKYKTILNAAHQRYAKCFKSFSVSLEQIGPLIEAWGKRHTDLAARKIEPQPSDAVLKQEFDEKVTIYSRYREIRETLKEMVAQDEQAIATCHPPIFDKNTLVVLQKMGVSMKEIGDQYVSLFEEMLPSLKTEKQNLETLLQQFAEQLRIMRIALEVLGKQTQPKQENTTYFDALKNSPWNLVTFAPVRGAVNDLLNQTPIVNAAVQALLAKGEIPPPSYAAVAAKET